MGKNRFHAAIANEGNSLNFNAIELSSPNLSEEEDAFPSYKSASAALDSFQLAYVSTLEF